MTAAAAMWQPDEMAVGQVVTMLDQAGVPDTAVQAAVKAQLDQLQTVPEFNRTVAHVFIRLTDRPVAMRMAAGLILKNNVRCHSQTMPPAQAAALKAELLAESPTRTRSFERQWARASQRSPVSWAHTMSG